MQQEKNKEIAICLAMLCVISTVVIVAAYFGGCTAAAHAQGLHKADLIGKYAIYPLGVMVVYLLPLLYFVQLYFYKAKMSKMWQIFRAVWIYECVCGGILVAYYLIVYLKTGSFLI